MPSAKRPKKPTSSKPKLLPPDPVRAGPLWEGPSGEGPNGGVTQGLISRYLTCPERFRLLVVEGLRPNETFSAPIEFGNMWHVCEEAHANGDDTTVHLDQYVQQLMQRFPFQREEIHAWYGKCVALFPLYVRYWADHDDVRNRTPLLSEQTFDVPYRLPSGRIVRLRGKWDSVDLVDGAVWLQENKTKGTIDQSKIVRQLRFDLQTMLYLVALHANQDRGAFTNVTITGKNEGKPGGMVLVRDGKMKTEKLLIKGARYNVVRRALHKTPESMLKKLEEDRANGRIGEWFGRWNVEVSAADVQRFRQRCLDPILEQMCSWWNYMTDSCNQPFNWGVSGDVVGHALHYQHPFGVRNVLDEGGSTDLDECVTTGSVVGLRKVDTLFEELA